MRRIRRNEEGAFLVIWALLLVAMLIMVAIVLDLGRLRDTRRRTQLTADLAALAAGQNMMNGDRITACRSALKYVSSNARGFTTGAETCAVAFASPCVATDPKSMTTTATDADGSYVITVRNPVTDAELADPNYVAGIGSGTVASDGLPCERMRVTVQRTNKALFAGVVGISDLTTRSTAVVRGFVADKPTQNAGLVVLERVNCEAINVSNGLASVLVKGTVVAGTSRPGNIQVDTKALEAPNGNCTNPGGNPSSKYAVFGTKLNPAADRPGSPSVEAEPVGLVNGRLDMYARTVDYGNIHTAYQVNAPDIGVAPPPTPGAVASRRVVDDVYNAGAGPGNVTQLKQDSEALLTDLANKVSLCPLCNSVQVASLERYYVYPPGTPTGPDAAGFSPIPASPGVPECTNTSATLIDVGPTPFENVYVNCPELKVNKIRFQGKKFALAGTLEVAGSANFAQFPNAQEVVVKGCGACTPGGPTAGIRVSAAALLINTGIQAAGPPYVAGAPLAPECNNNIDDDGDTKIDEFDLDYAPGDVLQLGDVGCQTKDDWDELSCEADRTAAAGVPPSRLVVVSGPLTTSSTSVLEICQTFVLMGGGIGSILPSETVNPAIDPSCAGVPNFLGVTVPKPCPTVNGFKGNITTSGSGNIDWTAPDQTSLPRDTSIPSQFFEDLALWTESSLDTTMSGGGATVTGGVFFLPNAKTTFSGQASQHIDLNAQFVSRSLEVSGQGTLVMKPNPDDVVPTPGPFFDLIR